MKKYIKEHRRKLYLNSDIIRGTKIAMVFNMYKCLFVLFLIYTLGVTSEDEGNVSYKIVLDKLEKQKEAEEIVKTDITFGKKDGKTLINGQVNQLVDINEDYKALAVVYFADDAEGQFKKLIVLPKDSVCKYMQKFYKKYFYDTIKNYSNAPDPDICPVRKNTYVIKDYPMDSNTLQKYLKPGFFRVECSLLHNDEEILKYIVHAHVEKD